MGYVWEGIKTGGTWTQEERRMHINEVELLALKLTRGTFLKAQEIKSPQQQGATIQTEKITVKTLNFMLHDALNR